MLAPENPPAPIPFSALRRFRRGAILVSAGDPADRLYIVRTGQVRIFLLSESGHETTTAVLGPGHVFGLSALLEQPAYHAFAAALTDIEVWTVTTERLVERLLEDPELAALLFTGLAKRLTLAHGLLRDVALLPVVARIPDAVQRLAFLLNGEAPRLHQGDLASLVGARRETVSRARARSRTDRLRARDGRPL